MSYEALERRINFLALQQFMIEEVELFVKLSRIESDITESFKRGFIDFDEYITLHKLIHSL